MAVRPIDGNKLIEWFRPYLHTGEAIPADVVIEDIRSMPTLAPPNEWVSVDERFPPPKQNVLAYSPSSGIAEADYADGIWMQYRWSAIMHGVTHWMPLPAPPERQEDTVSPPAPCNSGRRP